MLTGKKPAGCQYCWNIEGLDKNLISDRHIRTGTLYKDERINEIKNNSADFNVGLEYVEVSFSNVCNFKCGYCHPKASSKYFSEIKQFGPYIKSKNHRCDVDYLEIYEEESNPYLEAWWKWWPELIKTLKILRITGGEPLLQKSTYKMLNFLNEFPNQFLELNVNSNLGSREEIILDFSKKAQALVDNKKIKQFKLFSSIDTWGPQAEYIRTGLDLNLFENNLKNYLRITDSPLTLMMTFNIFSVVSFEKVLRKILEWRLEFQNTDKNYFHRIRFDISYLKEPLQYDINILPKIEYMKYMDSHLQFIKDNVDDSKKDKFSYMELQRFLRIHEYMKNTIYSEEKIIEGRTDFFNFFNEQDRRRNTNLLKTFPEMEDFWNQCQEVAEACG
ncbi:MAG: twitch domain-containing radical SAM protein [Pseudobdellovibrio sp.]